MTQNGIKHDPKVCGISPDTDCHVCRPKTLASRKREQSLKRLSDLEDRLRKANIDVKDLAELVWICMEASIEERIEKLAKSVLDREILDKVFITRIK